MMYQTIEQLYSIFLSHPKICIDSRKIETGCLFFALKGETFNGNDYAIVALEAGAAYTIVDKPDLKDSNPQIIFVPNVLSTLQQLAQHHRRQLNLPLIAITGTNGKTTTKELVATTLSTTYNVLFTEGNLNNHIGVPLTLLRLTEMHQLAVIEMGASKRGDIAELCAIAEPNYGLITNIGTAHLAGFETQDNITATKGELFDWLRTHEGKIFLNEQDEALQTIAKGLPFVGYGTTRDTVIQGEALESAELCLSLTWSAHILQIPTQHLSTRLVGRYNLTNVLAAIAVGLFFGISPEQIHQALSNYLPTNGRSQLIESPRGNTIIADAYNANPSSMMHAISNFFSQASTKPRLLVLGDMNELGEQSPMAHLSLHNSIETLKTDDTTIIYCGPIWSTFLAEESADCVANISELKARWSEQPISQHFILLKGSNSIGLNQLIPLL